MRALRCPQGRGWLGIRQKDQACSGGLFINFHTHIDSQRIGAGRTVLQGLHGARMQQSPLGGGAVALLCGDRAGVVEVIHEIGGELFELALRSALGTDV